MMHDVGRIQVPLEILNRPGKLSKAEAELVKMHADAGYDLLKDSDFSWPVAEIVRQHHERIDGSGYPRGLKGQEILLEARILAVADVVDSMNSNRPYRAALGLDAALDEIEDGKGARYDAAAADACTRLIRSGRFTFEQAGAQSVAPLVRGSAARRFGLAPTPLQRIANGFRG
jgi:HD-GYP domain-containing protein (c-di-GMP phosphodiesterase class II)